MRELYAALYRPASDRGDELIAIARDFSPRYEVRGADLVVVDISGLERLLGAAPVIGDELRRAVARAGIRAHVAIAATQTAAMLLAHTRPGLTVVAPGTEADAIARVAIGILEKIIHDDGTRSTQSPHRKNDPKISANSALSAFQRWGVTTLGDLAALPDAELVSRFGRPAVAWQMIARGVDVRPLIPTLDEERFAASIDLEWPIEGLEPLSFVLTRLFEPLCTRLERRDRAAAVVHVLLDLVTTGGDVTTGVDDVAQSVSSAYARRLELPSPMRDGRALRTLVLLDLESHPPQAAIDRVTIVVDPTPGRVLQHALFTRAHPTPEQLSTLLARLGAVMGQDRVGTAVSIDTYRPGAFSMRPFATDHMAAVGKSEVRSLKSASNNPADQTKHTSDFRPQTSPVSALRRCRQPVPARVATDADGRPVRVTTDRRGYVGGTVADCAGPWKTSGDWWASPEPGKSEVRSMKSVGIDQPRHTSDFRLQTSDFWDRDEWDVALGDGAVYRIFYDRAMDAWFIDAIVD